MNDQPGDRVDRFELIEVLGRGGNGVVWRARRNDLGEVALKLLQVRNPEKEPFKRFAREVEVQRQLADRVGVLPLLDANVPTDRSSRPWLATPVALPLSRPAAQAEVPGVIERTAALSRTLAELHASAIAHRDIKPDNLFLYRERAVLGDFGLVDDPAAQPITGEAGILGPRHYVAWEVLDDPDADWRPADVYALAKALWVMVTRQRFPVPGEHHADVTAMAVASYTPHPFASALDELLYAATRLDPTRRISADELAIALERLLAPASGVSVVGEVDDDALRRLADRLRPRQEEGARREELRSRLHEVLAPTVVEGLEAGFERIRTVAPQSSEVGGALHPNTTLGWRTMTDEVGSDEVLELVAVGFWAFTEDPSLGWSLSGGVALELLADGRLRLLAVVALLRAGGNGYRKVHERREEVPALSPRATDLCAELALEAAAHIDAGLAQWSAALAE